MNKNILLKTLSFVIIGLIILNVLRKAFIQKRTIVKDNRKTHIVKGFYEKNKKIIKCYFYGIYGIISPITLWDEYGITFN